MKLQPDYFNYILNGTKRIELRLNDEKRSQINLGDIILLKKEPDLNEYFRCKVVALLKYNSFEELFNDFSIEILADKSIIKVQLLNVIETFYSKEQQEKYNVLGIKIKLIN